MNWDTPEAVAAALVGIAKPDGLDTTMHDNEAIEEVNQSVLDDEAANPHKRKDYSR